MKLSSALIFKDDWIFYVNPTLLYAILLIIDRMTIGIGAMN